MTTSDHLPDGIASRVAAVSEATRQLVDAAQRENAALRGRDREALPAAAKHKAAAVDAYETGMVELEQASDGFALLSQDQRQELKALTATLAQVADENALLLRVSLAASRRIIDAVRDAAKDAAAQPGYGADGTLGSGSRPTARMPAVSLDQSL